MIFYHKKDLGQNFLENKLTVLNMLSCLEMKEGETLIEIGPGMGAITLELGNYFGNSNITIYAVEIDEALVDKLQNMFSHLENLKIINENILDWLPKFDSHNKAFKIIGSLPYYITTPIMHKILEMKWQPQRCSLIMQKEVAQKIHAKAPDSTHISCYIQTFYDTEILEIVDKKDFVPAPSVDGALIRLNRRKDIKITDIEKYKKFLNLAYSNPRKMLNKIFYQDELNRAGLNGNLRAQNYNWEKWVEAFIILR